MLARTAENLFWAARYLERAENVSRLLDMGYRMALMPGANDGYRNEWDSILTVAGSQGFEERYGDVTQANAFDFLFFDRDNPSSVFSCLTSARENVRAQRTAVTTEVWDALNAGYQELRNIEVMRRTTDQLPRHCEWIRQVTNQVRGAVDGTMLHGDGFDFFDLGRHLERAVSSAHVLDVKYYVLLPSVDDVGGGVDHYQWQVLLLAMSAKRQFHWAYGGEYTPEKITDFFLLNDHNPRSVRFALDEMNEALQRLSAAYGEQFPVQRDIRRLSQTVRDMTAEDIIADGLHEFLVDQYTRLGNIAKSIADTFFYRN